MMHLRVMKLRKIVVSVWLFSLILALGCFVKILRADEIVNGQKKQQQNAVLPVIKIIELEAALENQDALSRSLLVYACRFEGFDSDLEIVLDLAFAETDNIVQSLLLVRAAEFPRSSLVRVLGEARIVALINLLGPPDTLASVPAHVLLVKALKGRWPRTRNKFMAKWEDDKAVYFRRRKKVPAEKRRREGNGNASTQAPPRKRKKGKIAGQAMDFIVAFDVSSGNKEHLQQLKREVGFLVEIALFLDEENRVGAIGYCQEATVVLALTNDNSTAHEAISKIRYTTKGIECHDLPVYKAIDHMKCKNDRKVFLLITDEIFHTRGEKSDLYTKLFFQQAEGWSFHLLQPTNKHEIRHARDLGFEDFLEQGGGRRQVFSDHESELSLELLRYFVAEEARDAMEPFLYQLLQLHRRRGQRK